MKSVLSFDTDMRIETALRIHPKAKEVFEKYGMLCDDCMASDLETIRDGAKMHKVSPEQVIEELNKLLK